MSDLTEAQLHVLQHSLGVDQYGQGRQYRNHFVTGPGSKDWEFCRGLVDAGLMKDHGPQEIAGGMHCFCVSPAGIDAVALQSPAPPKLSRGKRRYRAYRNSAAADSGQSFGDFLKSIPWRKEQGYEA